MVNHFTTDPAGKRGARIIRGIEDWRTFLAKVEAVKASHDVLPETIRKYDICEKDTVTIKRELLFGKFHIPLGSRGVVIHERDNGKRLDVKFFCDPSTAITLFANDLEIAPTRKRAE